MTSPASSVDAVSSSLPVRTSCNYCRSKKIKCDKIPVEKGGCLRCRKEKVQCSYDVRDPIGRPKKRKIDESSPLGIDRQNSRRRSSSGSTLVTATPSREISRCCPPSPQESSSALGTTSASSSVVSPGQSSSTSVTTTYQGEEQHRTLSDLGLAAFLESLDTLEINNEDGLTPNMLQSLQSGTSFSSAALQGQNGQYMPPSYAAPSQLSLSSLLEVQSGTSYAVPADLSWADPSWLQSGVSTFQPMPQAPPAIKSEGPCPKTGKATCCCDAVPSTVTSIDPSLEQHQQQQRVHCVPNPNGKGCTCLCDVSVALINVRATLRQAKEQFRDDSGEAASTLQLTLSASQAVADQCACSASCPTCRSDPNTSLSASLLISSALQIYIRAVRTLRQGFGASHDGVTSGNEWDVSIGQYRPKPKNARRISLFAMKLELRDLRDAIAKVSNAANANIADSPQESTSIEMISPIDSLVIRKLHQQINQLLTTVEGIEQQQDAERE